MNVIKAVQSYVDRMVRSTSAAGMKVLLLDPETKGIVGLAYTMSQILEKEVYLVETIDATHEPMMHLKALCFLRPTEANMAMLKAELRNPKYSEYHIFFSNIVVEEKLRALAEADERSVVKQVQEFYADFYAINPDLFTLNLGQTLVLSHYPMNSWKAVDKLNYNRSVQGVLSLLLALRQRPYVRYAAHSEATQVFAREIVGRMKSNKELFDFRKRDGGSPLLLILDRRDDPVTPLLTQWTYQAMVHELLCLYNNRVDLSDKNVSKDMQDVVLSADQDPFFNTHMYSSFGELGVAVKTIMEEYQGERKMHDNISSIEDMQRFVENFPELRKKSHTVGKHVALMTQLVQKVDSSAKMDVSALEQDIVCGGAQAAGHYSRVSELLDNPSVLPVDALRLVMLYALRYERSRNNNLPALRRELMAKKQLSDKDTSLVDVLLRFAGADARGGDLFNNKSLIRSLARNVKRGVQGVSNVFTQHEPLIAQVLQQVHRNRLSKTEYPFEGQELGSSARVSSVIVFVVGGITFEEACKVAALNASGSGPHVILGGTCIHNSSSFVQDLTWLGASDSDRARGGGVAAGAGSGAGAAADDTVIMIMTPYDMRVLVHIRAVAMEPYAYG